MSSNTSRGSVYRTARGTEIDMLKLVNQNEMTPAVGNMKVNARGDQLGRNGEIIKSREEIVSANMPNQVNVRPAEPVTQAAPAKTSSKKNVADMDPEGNE